MSNESLTWLNKNTLIGFTDKRGEAWHYKASEQGDEPNHYAGAIPLEDVRRRLFAMQPVELAVSVLVPLRTKNDASTYGGPVLTIDGKMYQLAVLGDRKAITFSDRVGPFAQDFLPDDVMGLFKSGYTPHPYEEWLLDTPAKWLADDVAVSSAGLLRNRGQAWVELSVPENHSVGGYEYRANLLATTSLDGTRTSTFARTITGVVCDNTLSAALSEKGPKISIRHSKHSKLRQEEAMDALKIIKSLAADFETQAQVLLDTKVTDEQWTRFVETYFPESANTQNMSSAVAFLENKRNDLDLLWHLDPRVAPWQGSAFGVVQAANTWEQHMTGAKSPYTAAERQMMRTLAGEFDKIDNNSLTVLTAVLEGREKELLAV